MNPLRSLIALAVCIVLGGCGSSVVSDAPGSRGISSWAAPPTPVVPVPSGILLREAPADLGCDSIGWEGEPYETLTFHVDPDAAEPVWAESDTGAVLTTYWSKGFQAGTPAERMVLAPSGEAFVTDGEIVEVPQGANLYVHDYFVCLRPDKLYVLTAERG